MRVSLLLFILFMVLGTCVAFREQSPTSPPVVITPETVEMLELQTRERTLRIVVEIADTDKERETGLMFRSHLKAQTGMLFDFGSEQARRGMWMKNTRVPLDILFIDNRGVVVEIFENATPLSEEPMFSTYAVSAVLEIPGGTVKKFRIIPGTVVRHRLFPR